LATLVEKEDPSGKSRVQERDRGKPLSGKSTLNRLELHSEGEPKGRYKKIAVDGEGVGRFWVKMFLESRRRTPKQIVLDVDATFAEFHYRMLKTWTRSRRVVAKAEPLAKGSNPCFVVTSLSSQQGEA